MTVISVSNYACASRVGVHTWPMFGKHFASLYEGSMVGAGAVVFAVWGYVIAKQVPDRLVGSQVRLNPKLLATIIGEEEGEVVKAIKFLCAPDPHSTTKVHDGRRLVKLGEFDYQVVNGAKYRAIRDEESRREQNRLSQLRWRAKHGKPVPGEVLAMKAETQAEQDRICEATLPESVDRECPL
jgi:hypothetical protein